MFNLSRVSEVLGWIGGKRGTIRFFSVGKKLGWGVHRSWRNKQLGFASVWDSFHSIVKRCPLEYESISKMFTGYMPL